MPGTLEKKKQEWRDGQASFDKKMKNTPILKYIYKPGKTQTVAEYGANEKFKYEEIVIPEGEPLYILGHACPDTGFVHHYPGVQSLMIKKSEDHEFLISDENEPRILRNLLARMIVLFSSAVLLIFFGAISLFSILDWIRFIGGLA